MEASDQGAVPPPKQLTLERQLNKSILIGGSGDLTAMVMMHEHRDISDLLQDNSFIIPSFSGWNPPDCPPGIIEM